MQISNWKMQIEILKFRIFIMDVKLPKSVRKYIRKEKARIRKEILDLKEQERLIQELYQKFLKHENKRDIQKSN
jgi:hypothetical protein